MAKKQTQLSYLYRKTLDKQVKQVLGEYSRSKTGIASKNTHRQVHMDQNCTNHNHIQVHIIIKITLYT